MANTKILCVDDDERILTGLQRQQGDDFDISVAVGPHAALEIIDNEGPFAIVLSDMRMPEMNGVELLSCVRDKHPDTVRMILTGFAELSTTIEAVNQGHIFRFLSKPCDEDDLARAFEAGLRQYALVEAEKELVEGTLHGSVKVLSEVLSLVNPLAFGQSTRVRATVDGLLNRLHVENPWQIEIAAMLSALGCVTLPGKLLERKLAGQELSTEEEDAFSSHPAIAGELLRAIPRLEQVADIIAFQNSPMSSKPIDGREVPLECRILQIAVDFDVRELNSASALHALAELKRETDKYGPELLDALSDFVKTERSLKSVKLKLHEIRIGMVLAQDIRSTNGILLMAKAQEITKSARRLLDNFSLSKAVEEPIEVVLTEPITPASTASHSVAI